MQKIIFFFAIVFILNSCKQAAENKVPQHKDTTIVKAVVASANNYDSLMLIKYDSLVFDYVNHTNNELIKATRASSMHLEWLFDRTEKTDSATYFVFHIGHDVSDPDGGNGLFATDGWIYIDSLSKKVYEYDVINDRISEWKK